MQRFMMIFPIGVDLTFDTASSCYVNGIEPWYLGELIPQKAQHEYAIQALVLTQNYITQESIDHANMSLTSAKKAEKKEREWNISLAHHVVGEDSTWRDSYYASHCALQAIQCGLTWDNVLGSRHSLKCFCSRITWFAHEVPSMKQQIIHELIRSFVELCNREIANV